MDNNGVSHPGRGLRHNARLPLVATRVLAQWMKAHHTHPYPNDDEKAALGQATLLTVRQISDWFANARRRRGKPASWSNSQLSRDDQFPQTHNATERMLNECNCLPVNIITRDDSESAKALGSTIPRAIPRNRIYQCTFCTDSFTTKHDWNRHEVSLHLSLKIYMCCPFSPRRTDTALGADVCSYCEVQHPSESHIEAHNHDSCQARPPEARVFTRKDHLRQHLRAVHECELLPHMDSWVLRAEFINSRCGFCKETFSTWASRNEHLAAHFREGLSMQSWKGCRGLDTNIAAQVTLAMPPFLIGAEQLFPRPFSASNMRGKAKVLTSVVQDGTICKQESSWACLAIELQRFVKKKSANYERVSDGELQHHAQALASSISDIRAEIAAHNPEWLDLFKRAYSLDVIPDSIIGSSNFIPEDLEIYHDLGLTIPSACQKRRSCALVAMFSSDGPLQKTYRRFSSVDISLDRFYCFETIAKPWPESGVLGEILITRDLMFSQVIGSHIENNLVFNLGWDHYDCLDRNSQRGDSMIRVYQRFLSGGH